MPHLSEITKETRLLSKIGAVVFVVFLLVFFSFKGYGMLKNAFFPTPPPGPEIGFGKLQAIQFPPSNAIIPSTYVVNTIDGTLPATPDRLNVYVISTPSANLLALQTARDSAERAGFNTGETKISDTVYQWLNPSNNTTLVTDIVTQNFKVDGNLFNTIGSIGSEQQAINAAESFLINIRANTSDVDTEKTKVVLLSNARGQISGKQEDEEANLARVNMYQKSLGMASVGGTEKPLDIYYPYPDRTLISFVVEPNDTVIQGEFINRRVITDNYSTYPIITTQEAFENLQKGNGYVVINPNNQESVDISDVNLGYYIGPDMGRNSLGQEIKHVQPIYVFLGLNGFIGYVPAVAPTVVCDPTTGC